MSTGPEKYALKLPLASSLGGTMSIFAMFMLLWQMFFGGVRLC